ncbi:hypothetical protein GALMADRAFT_47578, partial [Galerina marginata CBS 339.88]
LEIGSPMAAMYLLGHDDYYTSHKFVPFYWRSYVRHVENEINKEAYQRNDYPELGLQIEGEGDEDEQVEISQENQRYYLKNNVYDYVLRPTKFENVNLYNWIQGSTKKRRGKKEQ